jgi:creatinine amidohydrolase
MRTVQLELLRPDEILAERQRCSLVYVPVGPLEWHQRHLPLGTDPLNAQAVARQAALITGGVVYPTLFFGTERERDPQMLHNLGLDENLFVVGMDFPGNSLLSMYTREEVFGIVIRETLEHLVEHGYALIVVVNGHGARSHLDVLERLTKEFDARSSSTVMLTFALAKDTLKSVGHADALETSIIQHLYPERVDIQTLPPVPGPIRMQSAIVDADSFNGNPPADHILPKTSDPRYSSSPEQGKILFDATVKEITGRVQAALDKV